MLEGEWEEGGERGAVDGEGERKVGRERGKSYSRHKLCLKKQLKWAKTSTFGTEAGACKTLT